MKLKLLLASATLAAGTTVLNAADERTLEKALLGHIMWSAFQCSTYAELSDYKSEQERLHLVGLNAGRTFLEAMKALDRYRNKLSGKQCPLMCCSGLKVRVTRSSSATFTRRPQATLVITS